MPRDIRDRRLVGYIWHCTDQECLCSQAVIDEIWEVRTRHLLAPRREGEEPLEIERWEARTERVWEGTFYGDPASFDWDEMRDELTGACERHDMEKDTFEPDRWEREL